MRLRKYLPVSILLLIMLTGCGGGGSSATNVAQPRGSDSSPDAAGQNLARYDEYYKTKVRSIIENDISGIWLKVESFEQYDIEETTVYSTPVIEYDVVFIKEEGSGITMTDCAYRESEYMPKIGDHYLISEYYDNVDWPIYFNGNGTISYAEFLGATIDDNYQPSTNVRLYKLSDDPSFSLGNGEIKHESSPVSGLDVEVACLSGEVRVHKTLDRATGNLTSDTTASLYTLIKYRHWSENFTTSIFTNGSTPVISNEDSPVDILQYPGIYTYDAEGNVNGVMETTNLFDYFITLTDNPIVGAFQILL